MTLLERTTVRIVAPLVISLTALSCGKASVPPNRPASVPESATWAGGPDGGNWFLCAPTVEGKSFDCKVYNDFDGQLKARGNFVFRTVSWDREAQRPVYTDTTATPELTFSYFDGHIIHLKDPFVLIPHGIIDYPFDSLSGKRQEYRLGEPIGPEEEYGADE